MNYDSFPPVVKQRLDERMQQDVAREKNRTEVTQRTITNNKSEKPSAVGFFVCGAVIGFAVDIFMCISKDNANTWWTILGLVLGGIIYAIALAAHHKNVNSTEEQLSSEISSSQRALTNITKTAEDEYREYCIGFEKKAQETSVNFAESQLAIEVIEWMTKGFVKTIDAADRRSHIQKIEVPFIFKTFKNKIECNLGTFDFEIKRCRNLSGPLEQTALARAIASAIQLNITMKYPQDVSGTNIVTNIGYSYGENFVSTTIVYTASNGNFKSVRDWN